MTTTTVAGVCSGVGGFDLAFQRADAQLLWTCEKEPAAANVLAKRFKGVPHFSDMLGDEILSAPAPDIFVGGTPCQGFSVAGLRKGLNDDRSNLALRFLQLCDHFKPAVILWENVPGVLSDKGNAFGCFLAGLVGADAPLVAPASAGGRWTNAGLVAGPSRTAAWRVLDSEYFGVAQRRNRVFVVASPRAELPFQILFEPEGLRRHFAPSRQEGQGTAPTLASRTRGGGGLGTDAECDGALIPSHDVCPTLRAGANQTGGDRPPGTDVDTCESLIPVAYRTNAAGQVDPQGTKAAALSTASDPCSQIVAFQPRYFNDRKRPAGKPDTLIPPLTANAKSGEAHPCIAFTERTRADGRSFESQEELAYALTNPGGGRRTCNRQIAQGYAVRRLTPTECERLQAFPDGWTYVQNAKGKHQADGPRYKQMGNAVTVNVVEWLARRILAAMDGYQTGTPNG